MGPFIAAEQSQQQAKHIASPQGLASLFPLDPALFTGAPALGKTTVGTAIDAHWALLSLTDRKKALEIAKRGQIKALRKDQDAK